MYPHIAIVNHHKGLQLGVMLILCICVPMELLSIGWEKEKKVWVVGGGGGGGGNWINYL